MEGMGLDPPGVFHCGMAQPHQLGQLPLGIAKGNIEIPKVLHILAGKDADGSIVAVILKLSQADLFIPSETTIVSIWWECYHEKGMSRVRFLYELQMLDLELQSRLGMLERINRELDDDEEVQQAREVVRREEANLGQLEKDQRWLEWQLDDLKDKIRSYEEKLYSGKITNPKELMGLQMEVEQLKARYSEGEDRLLELMERAEEVRGELEEKRARLREIEAQWREHKERLKQDKAMVEQELGRLNEQRQALVERLDAESLNLYENLKRAKETAVARVEQGRCGGCRLSLSLSELQRARNSLVFCSSCGRILYVA